MTTIDIPDMRAGVKKDKTEEEEVSDSDTEYDEEDDVKEDTKVEDKKEGKFFRNVVFIVPLI